MLNSYFTLTDARPHLESALGAALRGVPELPMVGSFNNGLLSVVDVQLGKELLENWRPIIGSEAVVIAVTGFGDAFYWDSDGVSFLEVQRGTTDFVDADAGWFLSDFLVDQRVLEKVLRQSQFRELVARHGSLAYSEIFILEPWPMLGGKDEPENYKKGKVSVYFHLVGQTLTGS